MIRFASRGINRRDLLGRAASGRDTHDSARTTRRQAIVVDEIIGPPTGAVQSHEGIDQYLGRTAAHRDLFEFAVGKEPQPLPVWRKERIRGSLGPRNHSGFELIKHSKVELRRVAVADNIRDATAVRIDG